MAGRSNTPCLIICNKFSLLMGLPDSNSFRQKGVGWYLTEKEIEGGIFSQVSEKQKLKMKNEADNC